VSPESHAKQRAALADRVRRDFSAAWNRVDPHAVRASWLAEIPRLLVTLTIAQQVAAASADAYVAAAVGSPAVRELVLGAFSHVASDGRALDSLLERPAVATIRALQLGEPLDRSMAAGMLTAQLIGHTQVADTGRVADLAATVANPATNGYVRLLVGRTCARCMVLAGRRYSWKADFKRHPRCDCTVVPTGTGVPFRQPVSPQQAFREMLPSEQDKVFGKAGADAIRQGADIGQVVNARTGMYPASGRLMTTTGGGRRPRLMPEQILIEAKGDRAEAVRLLSLHGYLR
jgi:hypothetical protein